MRRPPARLVCGAPHPRPPGRPQEEASYKLARVKKLEMGAGGVPYVVTHDGRTIRYPDPNVKARRLRV